MITKRLKGNDARSAAIYLIRKLTSISAVELARQYGVVSQAAISKPVSRAEGRCSQQRSWKPRLSRVENMLLSEE
ncbi:MAG: hypothetical protein R6U98_37005 [Pirellulaceae bacterium]